MVAGVILLSSIVIIFAYQIVEISAYMIIYLTMLNVYLTKNEQLEAFIIIHFTYYI